MEELISKISRKKSEETEGETEGNPNNEWDLEETIRQVEQKFATDLKTIAGKTTNDQKFLKTLVCIERKTSEQIPAEYKEDKKQSSTRFGVVSSDDKIIIPQAPRRTLIILLQKGHPAINKMSHSSKAILVAETNKGDTKQMRRIYPLQNGW